MLTFTDQNNMCKEISGLSDATSIINFKRDLNAGTARFLAKLNRPVDRQNKFTNVIADQMYYQFPEDAIRLNLVKYLDGTTWRPLQQIASEATWSALISDDQTGPARYYFARGADEFGIYPVPQAAVSSGLELVYEPKHILLTADDYTTGSLSVTNGSQTVTGNSTVFTSTMANGSYVLQVTDGSDGRYYPISGYTNATSITLENYYQGASSGSASYRIGQVSRIPEEYQEAPVDYAMYRHFTSKGEINRAKLHDDAWSTTLKEAEATYGMTTGNQLITAYNIGSSNNPFKYIGPDMIDT